MAETDLISRQAAIDAIEKRMDDITCEEFAEGMSEAITEISLLPSAEPERKTGWWIESNPRNSETCRRIDCSECGNGYMVNINVPYEVWTDAHKFCVECGAKMNRFEEE